MDTKGLHESDSSVVFATKQLHIPDKHDNHSNKLSIFRYTNSAKFCVSCSGLVCLSHGKNLSHKVYALPLE